jgi:hypothetical protein
MQSSFILRLQQHYIKNTRYAVDTLVQNHKHDETEEKYALPNMLYV